MKNSLDNQSQKSTAPKEQCLVCGVETEYAFNTPISERQFYIEGVGQLCQKCYYELYTKRQG